jgi:hypothetical protein
VYERGGAPIVTYMNMIADVNIKMNINTNIDTDKDTGTMGAERKIPHAPRGGGRDKQLSK